MKILVTGGAGFIGSNFIHYWLEKYPEDKIVNLDALTYAGNLANLKSVEKKSNYKFIHGDIGDLDKNIKLLKQEKIEAIINFAAESHNGRAMVEPGIFVKTNVLGTQLLLEAAKRAGGVRVHHVSTCEVFGDLALEEDRAFKETDPYNPKTPYNASKASADHEVMAYFHTFKLPVTISFCANNLGPYQFPEKLIPRFITNLIYDTEIPLFKSSENKREWTYVTEHCRAIDLILKKGKLGERYCVGSGVEKSVEEIADEILKRLNKPKSLKKYVEDRPGHDRRYLMDPAKIKKELRWKPEISFQVAMDKTVKWYKENKDWWHPLVGKGFVENYKRTNK